MESRFGLPLRNGLPLRANFTFPGLLSVAGGLIRIMDDVVEFEWDKTHK